MCRYEIARAQAFERFYRGAGAGLTEVAFGSMERVGGNSPSSWRQVDRLSCHRMTLPSEHRAVTNIINRVVADVRRRGWWPGVGQFVTEWAAVIVLGILALWGFAKVGEDVFSHESTGFDRAVQQWVLHHQHPVLTKLFFWATSAGGTAPMTLLAVGGAAYLWHRGKRRLAAGVLTAPTIAIVLFTAVKHIYARPRPAGLGGLVPSSYAFPSGHATSAAAVCCTLAYVFWQERLVSGRAALAVAAIVPFLIGLSRIYLNVHWATDVLGGWSAGLLVAVLAAALYRRNRWSSERDRATLRPPTGAGRCR